MLLDEDGIVIAMMRGWQKSFDSYYMQFTAVHTEFRKQGIYSELIDRVLSYTKDLGFSRVLSCHAPFNNTVLIAKLKKDFKIIGMDIDAALGINVWLCVLEQFIWTAYLFLGSSGRWGQKDPDLPQNRAYGSVHGSSC